MDGQRLANKIVKCLNREREESLQLAESEMEVETFRTIIYSIHPDERLRSFTIIGSDGMDDSDTILNEYICLQRNDIAALIIDSVSEGERFEFLLMEGLLRKTALHLACEEGNTDAVNIVRSHVNADQWFASRGLKEKMVID